MKCSSILSFSVKASLVVVALGTVARVVRPTRTGVGIAVGFLSVLYVLVTSFVIVRRNKRIVVRRRGLFLVWPFSLAERRVHANLATWMWPVVETQERVVLPNLVTPHGCSERSVDVVDRASWRVTVVAKAQCTSGGETSNTSAEFFYIRVTYACDLPDAVLASGPDERFDHVKAQAVAARAALETLIRRSQSMVLEQHVRDYVKRNDRMRFEAIGPASGSLGPSMSTARSFRALTDTEQDFVARTQAYAREISNLGLSPELQAVALDRLLRL